MRRSVLIACLVLLFCSTAYAGPTSADLPGVPLKRVQEPLQNLDKASKLAAVESKPEEIRKRIAARKKKEEPSSVLLAMKPGENLIIPVAIKHPNRILTPFDTAKVFTTRTNEVYTEGPIVYATPSKEGPMTMFITDKDGDQSVSLSLTLVPKPVPPREIKLVLDGSYGGMMLAGSKKSARKFERRNSHYEQINAVMLALAKQELPTGYSLRSPGIQDPAIICDIPGVSIKTGQVLDGYSLSATVSAMTNHSDIPVQIRESSCWQEGVMGVSTWPSVEFLQPKQTVELYVLLEKFEVQKSTAKKRPTLIQSSLAEVE